MAPQLPRQGRGVSLVTDRLPDGTAAFGMYPFESVRWAWTELWTRLAEVVEWVPRHLDFTDDVQGAWADNTIEINHVCGWPWAAHHATTTSVVGAFSVDLAAEPPSPPGFYRSVLLTRFGGRSLAELIDHQTTAVINQPDSLSGYLSLLSVTVGDGGRWPGRIVESGSHLASIEMLTNGEADLGCVDAWSLALIRDERPDLGKDLHRVGFGPLIPTPAVTLALRHGPRIAAELASGWRAVLEDRATLAARTALHISGWADHDRSVYDATLRFGAVSPARPRRI